jgi:hypothetical protein
MARLAALAGVVALLSLPVLAQTSSAKPVRIAGTVDRLDGNALTVNTKDGQRVSVTLSDDAAVYGIEKRTVADIKAGDFLASGGIKQADGEIHAVEVRIFPEALRGIGEGQRAWNREPDGIMTNATVGTVTQTPKGGVIHVTYKDGESDYIVGPDIPVLAYVAADRNLLRPGTSVVLSAQKAADGTLTARRLTAEKSGVKPPM